MTLDPDAAARLQTAGVDVVVGDYAKRQVLLEAGLASARAVVVADDAHERTVAVVGLVRDLVLATPVVARPVEGDGFDALAEAGASHVLTPERTSALGLRATMRSVLGAVGERPPLSAVVRFDPPAGASCPHVGAIRPVRPSSPGCEACLRTGGTWVHLRICLSCGHVGCCDSSPGRHARGHADKGHPIVESCEPGERWAHCFLDATTMTAADEVVTP